MPHITHGTVFLPATDDDGHGPSRYLWERVFLLGLRAMFLPTSVRCVAMFVGEAAMTTHDLLSLILLAIPPPRLIYLLLLYPLSRYLAANGRRSCRLCNARFTCFAELQV